MKKHMLITAFAALVASSAPMAAATSAQAAPAHPGIIYICTQDRTICIPSTHHH